MREIIHGVLNIITTVAMILFLICACLLDSEEWWIFGIVMIICFIWIALFTSIESGLLGRRRIRE